ncbi:OX-2 membrane glycoprotein-like isoform X2 [Echeneis naucrates]|uniref:OX-2 membrane glycoprotein-like n=1 Tax=Echeneis naucrates TaxID=173247 RepID=A0A665WBQ8_ECHNA|nr:OX-2 membrane glycoprotein-like isoform X2 [Echeneis naucrates]
MQQNVSFVFLAPKMVRFLVVHVLLALGVFPKGVTSVVQTHRTVVAAAGEDADFSCWLQQPKDVIQVTWQKISPDGEKNVGSYSRYSGPTVSPDFRDRVEIKSSKLQNSTLVVKNVTEQDEGCYLCLFNTYPDGALTARTCLQLSELHEPSLHVRESNWTGESVVSCSATGRPAPTLTLTVSQTPLNLAHYNTVRVDNNNGTVTVTATAVLPDFQESGAQVGCSARGLSAQKDAFVMIPEVTQTPADGSDQESGSEDSSSDQESGSEDSRAHWSFVVSVVLILIVCKVGLVVCWCRRKRSSSDGELEMSERPQADRSTEVIQKPAAAQDGQNIKKRTPTKNQKSEM